MQALFQIEQTQENPETVVDQFVHHRLGDAPGGDGYEDGRIPGAEAPLFAHIVRGAVQQQKIIDIMLADAVPSDWPWSRIDPVLRSLLRAACAELLSVDGVPAKVIINEYVDISQGFFAAPLPGLVNAVLDRLARELRVQEFCNCPG